MVVTTWVGPLSNLQSWSFKVYTLLFWRKISIQRYNSAPKMLWSFWTIENDQQSLQDVMTPLSGALTSSNQPWEEPLLIDRQWVTTTHNFANSVNNSNELHRDGNSGFRNNVNNLAVSCTDFSNSNSIHLVNSLAVSCTDLNNSNLIHFVNTLAMSCTGFSNSNLMH